MVRRILQPFYTGYVIIIFMATLFIVLPFYFIISLPNSPSSRKNIWRLTWIWSKVWLRLTGMWIKPIGKLPIGNKFVVVANHVSYIDPIVIYDVLPFYFRPLAKAEIKKAPIFGYVYAKIALLVDRTNVQSRAKSMRNMQEALDKECSIFIYPEGTFNEGDQPLKSFFDGAFRLSIEAQVPILPIIFPDTKERWDNKAWWKMWPGKNRAYILDTISPTQYKIEELNLFKDKVSELMALKIIELKV